MKVKLSGLLVAGMSMFSISSAMADVEGSVHGYLREYVSVNLEDHPETDQNGKKFGGKGELSMLRTTLKLEGDMRVGLLEFKSIVRASKEIKTDYLKDLEDAVVAGGGERFIDDQLDEATIRELYVGFSPTENTRLYVGKQQIAWGEADFFRSTDVVNGFDFRWRSNLERENEETRNPLNMVNFIVDFPSLDASLQLIYRPGWGDSDKTVVNQLDLYGGRNASQPGKGTSTLAALPYNFNNSAGDTEDANYGLRWESNIFDGQVDYSLLYYRGLNKNPVINSVATDFNTGVTSVAMGDSPTNGFADLIFPFLDTFGLTYNADIDSQRMVVRGEVAYIPNQPYNIGTNFTLAPGVVIPGLGGIKEKATMNIMLGFDKQVSWTQDVFGARRPSTWTVEAFDRWITNFDSDDDLIVAPGYGASAREHQTIFTSTLTLNYKNDDINPSVAILWDMGYGDVILLPAIEVKIGNNWRIYGELSLQLPHNGVKKSSAEIENDSHILALGANNSQALLRVTYQF